MRAPGLRGRLLVAFVATSLVTLLAAAAALLSPLQARLREQSRHALQTAVLNARPQISGALRRDPYVTSTAFGVVDRFEGRTNARVVLYAMTPEPVARYGQPEGEAVDDVYRAWTSGRTVTTQRQQEGRIAVPLLPARSGPARGTPAFVLTVRKADTDAAAAVSEVRDAFLKAALIGLGVALAFALVLSSRLSRRLGRLRRAALRMTREGMDAPPPVDSGSDEIADLARAMGAMQEGLRRQEAARRAFVSTASHELRTPLTSISGTLELLSEDLEREDIDRADAREQVRGARRELARLRNLAAELLDLSRLDAGVALRSEPVELGELARAVAAEFTLQARATDRLLDVVPPRGPCWALGDPDAVARITRILVDNALRYAPEGARVEVVPSYAGELATLAVSDDGPGIAVGERDAVFERFRRGTTAAGESGFGLGLAIGRELAERLGGRLAYEPRSPTGSGARFVLSLPIELPSGGHPDEDLGGDQAASDSGAAARGVSL